MKITVDISTHRDSATSAQLGTVRAEIQRVLDVLCAQTAIEGILDRFGEAHIDDWHGETHTKIEIKKRS